MFGHLKAGEFINAIEGATLPEKRRAHLASCARCSQTLQSVRGVQSRVMELAMTQDENIPEPDWSEFRGNVRDALLSRSVKREAAQKSWTGWSWRPAMVWSMSAMFVLGLSTGLFVWNKSGKNSADTAIPVVLSLDSLIEPANIAAISNWAEPDPFEELVQLEAAEVEVLGNLLQEITEEGPHE